MNNRNQTINDDMAKHLQSIGNRLIDEPSTYLRQHANNPVFWQPWDKQALDLANLYDKPILLSIGYSACHWCHVMAHECFEDENVAALMNAHFINIKVDREERPDIDQIYMAALTAMGEQGGWPLTIFLSPQGDAFWGGTYFPKHPTGHMPGFMNILSTLSNLWENERPRLQGNITALKNHLQERLELKVNTGVNEVSVFQRYADTVARRFDPQLGGLSGQPKFPNFPLMTLLWTSWLISGQQLHKQLYLHSLEKMLSGGIYDHLAGGLARYSTDALWLVPHFEKMLYDNAQTIRLAVWAYTTTQNKLFRKRIEEIIHWLQTEMLLPDGGYASGLDADSEGIEGKFYVWDKSEIDEILGQNAEVFNQFYDVTFNGNWEGKTILNQLHGKVSTEKQQDILSSACKKLLAVRNTRIRPVRDDKCLSDWNGYLIRALAEAGQALQRTDWIDLAITAYRSIISKDYNFTETRLVHCRSSQNKFIPALSTDYAALINAALTLYQTTGDQNFLNDAHALKSQLDQYHRDQHLDYRLTGLDQDDVIFHLHSDQDEAIPSATSQIIEALSRLSQLSDDTALSQQTKQLAERALGRVSQINYGQAGVLTTAVNLLEPISLVLIVGDRQHAFAKFAATHPDPRRCDIVLTPQQARESVQWASFATDSLDRPVAILCRDNRCLPPIYQLAELQQALDQSV